MLLISLDTSAVFMWYCIICLVVPWLVRLITEIVRCRPAFVRGPVRVWFVLEKVAMGHVFLREFWSSLISIIPSMLRTHLHAHATLTRWSSGRFPGTLHAWRRPFSYRGAKDGKIVLRCGKPVTVRNCDVGIMETTQISCYGAW